VERHADAVLHVEEVAHLLAVPVVGAVAAEQAHAAGLAHLPVGLVHERAHVALVVLVGAEDVEELAPDHPAQRALPRRPQVEQLLAVAVAVERPQPLQRLGPLVAVVHPRRAVAVGGRARRVHEARAAGQRPAGERLGELEVVARQVARVALGGRRAGAHVEHAVELAERAALEARDQVVGLEVVLEGERREVAPLGVGAEAVAHHHAVGAAAVERPHECRADEAGAARDERAAEGPRGAARGGACAGDGGRGGVGHGRAS
jgi:hypothetical protein